MKKLMTLALLMLVTFMAHAQMLNPVKFSSQLKLNGTAEGEIIFSGKIDKGWHVYSTGLGNDGPISATFNVNKLEGVQLVGKMKPMGHEISAYDNIFGMKPLLRGKRALCTESQVHQAQLRHRRLPHLWRLQRSELHAAYRCDHQEVG